MSVTAERTPLTAAGAHRLPWLRSVPWWVCLLSFSCLGLTQAGIKFTSAGGTLAPALFLALWLGLASARPRQALARMLSRRLVYALPLLALASTLWAPDPVHTARTATEFLVTLMVATFAAGSLPPGMFVSATMVASLLQVLASLASGLQQDIEYAGNEALTGLFGSKNYMGYIGALLALLALATAADRRQPRLLRAAAALGLLLGMSVVVQARSADALLALGAGLAPLCYVVLLERLPYRARIITNSGVAIVGIAGVAIGYALRDQLFDLVLNATGKDAGLTGRTYLWDHAKQFIALRPLRGLGYQAFWTQGNPDAEGLWRHFQITERGGFSFHNMYYNISVDLGALGAIVWFGVFGIVLIATAIAALRRPSPPLAFFFAFLVFTGIRLFVETELMGPFDIGPILLACAWVYVWSPSRSGVQ